MDETLIVALDSHDTVQDIVIEGKDASDLVNTPDIHYVAFSEGEFSNTPLRVSFTEAKNDQIKITVVLEFDGEKVSAFIPKSDPAVNALDIAKELAVQLMR